MWPLVLWLALAQAPPLRAHVADPLLCATTEEMAKAAGYAVEAHEVRTADGYVVRLDRLVGGRPGGQPALLLHGLFCASDLWLLRGPGAALGYLLADDGYDVWLMNFRGNRYSARHTTLNTTDPSFWKFRQCGISRNRSVLKSLYGKRYGVVSTDEAAKKKGSWHEMAVWDLPATIDHVLAVTGWRQLQAVGHSMGNTALLAMLASRPQYARKLALGSLLAPVAYVHTFRVPFSHFLLADWRHIQSLLQRARIYRVPPTTKESCSLLQKTCGDDKPTQDLCLNLIQTLYGWDPQGLNRSALPFYLSHMFAGVSVDTIAHFAQIIKSGRFEAMDRGPEENLRRYGSTRPPAYHLQRIDAPLALYYADNDYELHPKGVMRLAQELQNVVSIERVPETAFNHIDFLLHKRVLSLLYSSVMAVMQQFRHSIAANISP